jgi:MFS family permease
MAEVIPDIKASQFGLLLAAGSAGLGVGALLLGQFGSRWPYTRSALFGSFGMGAALVALASTATHLWGAVTAIVCLGAAAAFVGIPMQTTIQHETPEEMRGKVFGLQNNAVNVALSLPLALSSVAEAYWGLPAVLLLLAVLAIAGGVATWYISVTSLQRSTSEDV